MMRNSKVILIALLATLHIVACSNVTEEARVEGAVRRMLGDYPNSTLQDIYKSFFQDRFGPGHIVADTTKAIEYLRYELTKVGDSDSRYFEPTGDCGNYYRVALSTVTHGKISFNEYASAFLRSIKEVRPIDIEAWKEEWHRIEKIISGMELQLPGYDSDAEAIAEMFSKGQYAVHHSRLYNASYHPHYRIISKDIFKKEIEPLLK